MIRSLLRWLWRHPLVWIVPLLFFSGMAAIVVTRLVGAPRTEFIYDV